ncbi:hypothetical protein EVAR_37641_1 [Eumeta japonica]|uniref:Uncharacterized protein n=1 Tax=Eumeta variegata TaxID=151549 RepID=A0A4C1VNX7_EUMVA|nr:hypothetical protein EVAR_37641_1 [Eumeta japonica]
MSVIIKEMIKPFISRWPQVCERGGCPRLAERLMRHQRECSGLIQPTLLSRALQGDGWLATVSDAPLPLHFIGGASVAHDTEQPSLQLTPARRSSKWDAAERHQSSRRPPHEPGCQDPGRSS